MKPYDHKKIEKKWQNYWAKKKLHEALDNSKKPKFYGLIEFPYPSGEGLHVGHIRSNTAMDILARKRRMEGFNVLYPIGWDAFGLPTENYAIKTGVAPERVTQKNVGVFKKQLIAGGFSFDWDREVNTSDPNYYKWTQWIFLKMFEKGLAYKKKMIINWCPKDKIGLANEEVIDGKCERCGTEVEKREKEQWMLAITKYAERLDKDLDTVNYEERIKIQQRNWIGKSEGAEFEFPIKNHSEKIKVFTTRADTLFGVTYIVLAPEHALVQKLKKDIQNWPEVEKYIQEARKKDEVARTNAEKVKTGVELKGISATNPANNEKVAVWIADYVLPHYGTGAVMAVPAHDDRDFAFAQKYNLPVKEVIIPRLVDMHDPPKPDKKTVERQAVQVVLVNPKNKKVLCLRWKKFPWTTFITGGIEGEENPVDAAKREITEETGYKNVKFVKQLGGLIESHFFAAHKDENRKAIFHSLVFEIENEEKIELEAGEKAKHEPVWLTWEELAADKNIKCSEYEIYLDRFFKPAHAFAPDGVLLNSSSYSGLQSAEAREKIAEKFGKKVTTYKLRDWIFSRQRYWGEPIPMIWCPSCDKWIPVSEKDLPVKLPKVKNYQPTDTGESPLAGISKWVNVKCPVCKGQARRETDTMPNWAGSSWYYLRYTDPKNKKALASPEKLKYWLGSPKPGEGGVDWYNGGMEHTTLHLLYSRFWHKFLFDIGVVPTSEPYQKRTSHGFILAENGEKMSKSRGNVVNPDAIIEAQGADTLRLYEMFMGPFAQMVAWSTDGIVGPRRFLERVWKMQTTLSRKAETPLLGKGGEAEIESLLQKTIKKVSNDIENLQFNTAVSSLMILSNEMEKLPAIPKDIYETFLKLLFPFAPHICEELWASLGHKKSLVFEAWPKFDLSKVSAESAMIAVQVNGKIRAQFKAFSDMSEGEMEAQAKALPEVKKWLEGKTIQKVIVVKNKLISIVVS